MRDLQNIKRDNFLIGLSHVTYLKGIISNFLKPDPVDNNDRAGMAKQYDAVYTAAAEGDAQARSIIHRISGTMAVPIALPGEPTEPLAA